MSIIYQAILSVHGEEDVDVLLKIYLKHGLSQSNVQAIQDEIAFKKANVRAPELQRSFICFEDHYACYLVTKEADIRKVVVGLVSVPPLLEPKALNPTQVLYPFLESLAYLEERTHAARLTHTRSCPTICPSAALDSAQPRASSGPASPCQATADAMSCDDSDASVDSTSTHASMGGDPPGRLALYLYWTLLGVVPMEPDAAAACDSTASQPLLPKEVQEACRESSDLIRACSEYVIEIMVPEVICIPKSSLLLLPSEGLLPGVIVEGLSAKTFGPSRVSSGRTVRISHLEDEEGPPPGSEKERRCSGDAMYGGEDRGFVSRAALLMGGRCFGFHKSKELQRLSSQLCQMGPRERFRRHGLSFRRSGEVLKHV
eukprot:jgi/Mesvir1/318/Mv22728-RA.1